LAAAELASLKQSSPNFPDGPALLGHTEGQVKKSK